MKTRTGNSIDFKISFSLSKKVKEIGFNEPTLFYYDEAGGQVNSDSELKNHNSDEKKFSAPFASEISLWLNSKHGIQFTLVPGVNSTISVSERFFEKGNFKTKKILETSYYLNILEKQKEAMREALVLAVDYLTKKHQLQGAI